MTKSRSSWSRPHRPRILVSSSFGGPTLLLPGGPGGKVERHLSNVCRDKGRLNDLLLKGQYAIIYGKSGKNYLAIGRGDGRNSPAHYTLLFRENGDIQSYRVPLGSLKFSEGRVDASEISSRESCGRDHSNYSLWDRMLKEAGL